MKLTAVLPRSSHLPKHAGQEYETIETIDLLQTKFSPPDAHIKPTTT